MANVEMVGKAGRQLVQETSVHKCLSKGMKFVRKEDESAYVEKCKADRESKDAINAKKTEDNKKAEEKKAEKKASKKKTASSE